MAGGCKLLDVRILYCQVTDVLVNLQMLFSFVSINNANVIFYCATCFLHINGKVLHPFRIRALRMGYPVYFRLGNILNLKQKPQNTKVKDTGLMRSQIFSSFYTVIPGISASLSPTSPGWSDSHALGSPNAKKTQAGSQSWFLDAPYWSTCRTLKALSKTPSPSPPL